MLGQRGSNAPPLDHLLAVVGLLASLTADCAREVCAAVTLADSQEDYCD